LAIAEENTVPVENLITPDYVRRAMWTPPKVRDEADLTTALADQLAGYGARSWQIDLVNSSLVFAVLDAERND
jgi:ribonuclease D